MTTVQSQQQRHCIRGRGWREKRESAREGCEESSSSVRDSFTRTVFRSKREGEEKKRSGKNRREKRTKKSMRTSSNSSLAMQACSHAHPCCRSRRRGSCILSLLSLPSVRMLSGSKLPVIISPSPPSVRNASGCTQSKNSAVPLLSRL